MSLQLCFSALQWQNKLLRGRQKPTDRNNDDQFDIENPPSLEEPRRNGSESSVRLPSRSIYVVPNRLRHVNEKAYTPKVVSIGPIHHGRAHLLAMENLKAKYLQDLICITNLDEETYMEVVRRNEEELRAYYDEPIRFDSDEFVKIVLMDAAFIIGVLFKFKYRNVPFGEDDRIFGKPWLLQDVWVDMLLIENQLPFFILKDLSAPCMRHTNRGNQFCIFNLVHYFFSFQLRLEVAEDRLANINPSNIEHFVDFLRHLHLPSSNNWRGKLQKSIPSIRELHQAGVKFEVGSSKNLFDLEFKNGKLKIPKLIIGDETEVLIRNLIAFEQCHYKETYINDYVILMNRLINTKKDLNLVAEYEIVENWCSNSEQGSSLINKLQDGVIFNYEEFYFASHCEELNKYYRTPLHKWKADLKQKYFNTPWAATSVAVGAALLILTLIQTICSIISVM